MSNPAPCHCNKASWIEFQLCEPLTSETEKACARVVRAWQGAEPPAESCNSTACNSVCDSADVGDSGKPSVCVHNLANGQNGYTFTGEEGDAGLAVYDDVDDKYRIVVWKSCCVEENPY